MDLFNLFIKISAKDEATQALGKVKSETDKTTTKFEKLNTGLKKVGDGIKTTFSVMSKVVAGTAGVFAAGVATINNITESTREYREDIGKLTTAFETAGISQEAATDTYKSFFSVIGEEDRSVEAVNHLAKLTQGQEDLQKWTDICAGVWGTFGDSLPIEGLTEAANETAKVGQVTGPLADALNWAGVNEDEFNQSLAACNDEQERATLITDTLNGLYKDAAENYKAANGEIMDARLAQSELTDATAKLGEALEPVSSAFKFFGADLINTIAPSVSAIGESIVGVFSGESGAEEELGQGVGNLLTTIVSKITEMLPTIMNVAVSIVTALVQGLSSNSQQIATSAMQIISTLFTGILQNLPTILSAGLSIILTLAEGIIEYLPEIFSSLVELITTIAMKLTEPSMLQKLITVALELILALVDGLGRALPQLISVMPIIIMNIATALIKSLPKILSTGVQIIESLISGVKSMFSAISKAGSDLMGKIITAIKNKLSEIKQKGKDIINNLLSGLKEKWENVKSWFSNAWDNLFGGKSVNVNVNKSGAAVNGSHAGGLSYVPFDGYIAELHRGERVLTAQDNKKYTENANSGSGVTVNQYIYAEKQSAADLMKQALYQQKRAVIMGV